MPSLSFTLLPPAISRLHEALSCLARFDDSVYLEASKNSLSLSTINTSKTAYACFKFDASTFFDSYHHDPAAVAGSGPQLHGCQFLNKALASVFKRRSTDTREKQSAAERCDVQLFSGPDETECRLLIQLHCHSSVVYTYRLTYEAVEVMHARYDQSKTQNSWTIDSRVVRDVVEYFGPKTEQLDWFYANDKVTFTSYTEKVQHGRAILKQPMHTSVALERRDFIEFDVQAGLHICMVVKDFRTVVAIADALHTSITARYSHGNRPLQFSSEIEGMACEFTVMTRGHSDVSDNQSATSTPARDLSVRPVSRPQQIRASAQKTNEAPMPPPPIRSTSARPSAPPNINTPSSTTDAAVVAAPPASLDPNSIFIPADDDQAWDEPDYTAEEDDVGWDASLNRDSFSADPARRLQDGGFSAMPAGPQLPDHPGIAPTQRLSEVRGLFD